MARVGNMFDVYKGQMGASLAEGTTAATLADEDFKNAAIATAASPVAIPIALVDGTLEATEKLKNFVVADILGAKQMDSDVFNDNAASTLIEKVGMQGFADLYQKNRGAYQGAGDVVTLFTGVGAIRSGVRQVAVNGDKAVDLARAGTKVKGATNAGTLVNLATLPTRATMVPYNVGVKKFAASGAGKKIFGDYSIVQKQIDELDNLVMSVPKASRNLTDLRADPKYVAAVQNLQVAGAKQAAREAVFTEALIVASLWDSDFLYPEGMTPMDHAFWAGVGIAVPTGIDSIVLNATVRNSAARVGGKAVEEARSAAGFFSTADVSTTLLMNARIANTAEGALPELTGVAKQNTDQQLTVAKEGIRRGVERLGAAQPVETFTAFKPSKAQELMVERIATDNPNKLRGVTSFNDLSTGTLEGLGLDATRKTLADELDVLAKRDDLTREQNIRMARIDQQLDEIDKTTMHGLDVDGTVFVVGERADTVYDDMIKIRKGGKGGYANVIGQSRGDNLTPAGKLTRKVTTPHMANLKDVTNTYALMPAAKGEYIEELRKAAVAGQTGRVTNMLEEFTDNMGNGEKLSYLQVDYALEVLQAMKSEPLLEKASKQLANGFAVGQIDDLISALETAGLQKKFADLEKFVATRKGKKAVVTPMDLSRRYNLNMHHGDSRTPTPVYDEMMRRVAAKKGNYKSFDEFKMSVDTLAATRAAANAEDVDVVLKGNNLDIDLATQPMIYSVNGEVKTVQETMSVTAAAEVMHAEKIDRTLSALEYYPEMAEGIFANTLKLIRDSNLEPEIKQAIRTIFGGQEGQAAVRGGKGQVAAMFNSIVPQDRQFRNRNVNGLALIDALMDTVYKSAQKQTTEMFKPYKEVYRKFHTTREGKVDQVSMNLYLNARGAGFDLDLRNTKKFGETLLEPTTKNIDLLSQYLGKKAASKLFADGPVKLPDMTLLRDGKYQPVFVSAGAEEILGITNRLYQTVQENRNVLRFGGGEEVIVVDKLMLPPAFTGNKEMAVILKRGSNDIEEVVFGNSPQQALDKARALANDGQHVASRAEVEQILPHRLNNKLAETSYNSAGTANTDGALALEGMNRWLVDSMNNVAKSSVNRIFEPQMNFLRQQQTLQERMAPKAIGNREQVSVYETTRNVMLNNKDEATGNFVIKTQNRIDELLDGGIGFVAEGLNKASAVLSRHGGKVSPNLLDEFAEKANYRPTERMFEAAGIGMPATTQAVARKLNGMAGFFMLRMMEASQALLNVASIPTVVPALASQLGFRAGETYEQYQRRVGGFADLIGKGNLQAAPSPMKGMMNAVHLYSSGKGSAILKEAEDLGNMYAPAVELQEHVFTKGKTLDNKYFDKFTEIITKPTDWTEKFSRQLSYLQGYDTLRRMSPNMTKMELHTAANTFANRAVGDYRTVNKPQQFQGGIGASMGLFQTFFINYWQRMGDMIETGNKQGLVTLYGAQASMFGLESVPGYDVYNQMWSNYDGSVAPTDLFAESFGVETAEVMLTGGLSNIPKFFGQDGIALYSRGDTNVRQIPNITNALQVPALNMIGKVGKGIAEYGRTARALGEMPSYSRSMEILAGSVPNRPAAGLLEIVNGHAVNRGGDLTVKNTRDSAARVVSRLMGAKTVEEDRTAQAMWRSKLQQRKSQEHVSTMRRDFAAQIRQNDGKLTVKMLDKFHQKHYEKLQNPKTFETWIGNLYKKSVDEKSSRDMLMLYKRIAKAEAGPYQDMQMRRLVQLMIANQTAMQGASEIANR